MAPIITCFILGPLYRRMTGLERLYGGSDPGQVWSFIILYTMFFGAVLSGGFAAGFFIF